MVKYILTRDFNKNLARSGPAYVTASEENVKKLETALR